MTDATDRLGCPFAEAPPYPMAREDPLDPPPELTQLRHERPVARVRIWDGSTPWIVSRYDDVKAVLTDDRVSADTSRAGFPHTSAGSAARRQRARSFINMDDPDHAAQRRLLTSEFIVKKMNALRPRVDEIASDLLDDLLAGPRPADLVAAFALPLPSLVICELLGVPYEDREFLHQASRTVISRTSSPEESVAATEDLLAYLKGLVERKVVDPGDDVLSRLATGQLADGSMTSEEIASMGQLLLVAGHETTANMIGLGTLALLEHPEQAQELRSTDDPAVVASAVEELLRYLSIVHMGRRRIATADLEVGGQLIQRGDGIIAAGDAANRDEDVFDHPDDLDIHRGARHHVAFGYGVHQCLGQPLARMELQVAYPALLRRIPTLALAVDEADLPFKDDMIVYGVHQLPVTW